MTTPRRRSTMPTVVNHLKVKPDHRDIDWVRQALQSAIAIEHSTLPLYCAAMFSLEVQNYSFYNTIRSVLMEEMVHMAIAANVLAALGGSPQIKTLNPAYPCHGLPGGVEPDLYLGLAKLSPEQLKNFLRLEAPLFLLPDERMHEQYPTISKFYQAIKRAISENSDEVRAVFAKGGPANQVGDNIGFTTFAPGDRVDPMKMINQGIDEILEQGEGSTAESIQTGSAYEDELSHYGKFAELFYGARYRAPTNPYSPLTHETEAQWFKGTELARPQVINILAVPSDGYAKILERDPDGADVTQALRAFDACYSGILTDLDTMWNGSAETLWPTFGEAVKAMTDLRVLSCFNIMRCQVPPSLIVDLPQLYPDEFAFMSTYTDLTQPVFYGPRFSNTAI
jgi:Ferritin-like